MHKATSLKILMISTDKGLLGRNQLGDVVERHKGYGTHVERLDIIVQCKKAYEKNRLSENVVVYPTNSYARLLYVEDTVRIGNELFKKNDYNLLITQDPFLTGFAGLRLKEKHSTKLLVHLHGDFFENPYWLRERLLNRLFLFMGKQVVKRANAIRVMSKGQKEKLLRMGIDERRVRVISTPIEISRFESDKREKISQEKKIVLMVGRRDKVKDFETLFRAFKKIIEKRKDSLLWLVGSYANYRDIPLSRNAVTLEPHVTTEDMPSRYKQSDVVVLSSTSESFGKVLVEANACGKPVIATATTGAQEIIKDGYNGFLVPIGDAEALAEKILFLLEHPKKAEEMGENGRESVKRYINNNEKIFSFWNNIVHERISE